MAEVLLTYDIDDKHEEFKDELQDLGYSDQLQGPKKVVNLPNTTMYHSDKTAKTARDDARTIAKNLNVDLERCIAVEINTWAAIVGEEHVD